jgi:hypothetical protein
MDYPTARAGGCTAFVASLAAILLFFGCESPTGVDLGRFDEEKAYFEFVLENDDFFTSEEDVLDDGNDNGMFFKDGNPEPFNIPIRLKRSVLSIEREFIFDFSDDNNTAVVTMMRTIEGVFRIRGQMTSDALGSIPDTTIEKYFTETSIRMAKFEKIDDTGTAENDWTLTALSLLEGGTPEAGFAISHLKMTFGGERTFEYDDPLETFLYVAEGRNGYLAIPSVSLETIRQHGSEIEITINSPYPDPEIVYLRYGAGKSERLGLQRYIERIKVDHEEGDEDYTDGLFTRTYVWTPPDGANVPTTARDRGDSAVKRFSAVVETISFRTVSDLDVPVETHYWGVPFFNE